MFLSRLPSRCLALPAWAAPPPAHLLPRCPAPGPCSLNLKQCKQVGDAGLAALAPHLPHLTALHLQVGLSAVQGLFQNWVV